MASPFEVLSRIWQLAQLIMDDSHPVLEELGLHPKGFFLLTQVESCPFPAELARVLCLPPPTVTYIIKQLEQKDYLRRKAEPGDLRKFRLVMTPEGKHALEAAQARVNQLFGDRLGRITPTEIAEFERVIARLAEARTDPEPGPGHPSPTRR